MNAAEALDLARLRTPIDDWCLLVIALGIAAPPRPDEAPWSPAQLAQDRLSVGEYAERYGMLRD